MKATITALALVVSINTATALDEAVRILSRSEQMLAGMPTLISLAEAGRTADGRAVVIYTTLGEKTKTVAPMPASGIYPDAVFRYRAEGKWYHEINYSDGSQRRIEVSR